MLSFSKEYALAALTGYLQARNQDAPVIVTDASLLVPSVMSSIGIDAMETDGTSTFSEGSATSRSISPVSMRSSLHSPTSPLPRVQSPLSSLFHAIKNVARDDNWTERKCNFAKAIYAKISKEPLDSSEGCHKLIAFIEAHLEELENSLPSRAGEGELESLLQNFIDNLRKDYSVFLLEELNKLLSKYQENKPSGSLERVMQHKKFFGNHQDRKDLDYLRWEASTTLRQRLSNLNQYLTGILLPWKRLPSFEEIMLHVEQGILGIEGFNASKKVSELIIQDEYTPLRDILIRLKPGIQDRIQKIQTGLGQDSVDTTSQQCTPSERASNSSSDSACPSFRSYSI
jgi:hypothetical protein